MRVRRWPMALMLVLVFALCSVASAQTRWPDFAVNLPPGPSRSPVRAELLAGKVEAPGPDVPRDKARWSGPWAGWACRDLSCDTKLLVERVTTDGATIVYAFASATAKSFSTRVDARFVGSELQATLPSGAKLAYRMRSEGVLEFLVADGANWSIGVLTKEAATTGRYTRSTTRIPVNIDRETIKMEFHVYKPDDSGPLPALIFNHGSTGRGTDPSLFKRPTDFPTVGEFFASRGYAVIFPSRRGRGDSEGMYDEGFDRDRSKGYSCDPGFSLPGADRALRDIDAAVDAVVAMNFVDRSRLLIGGVSRGGILSVAYAGMRPERIMGVVNFVGGWMTDQCSGGPFMNHDLFKRGARFGGPTIWLYGDNDPFYPMSHSRANFSAFLSAGGRGSFHEIRPSEGIDGHAIVFRPKLWETPMEAWLKSVGFPATAR